MNRALFGFLILCIVILGSCIQSDPCRELPTVRDLSTDSSTTFQNLSEIKFYNAASRSETLSFNISRDTLFTKYEQEECPQFSENIYTSLQEVDSKLKMELVQFRVYSDSLRNVQDLLKIVISKEEEMQEYLFNKAYLVDWTGYRLYQREAVFQRDSGLVQFNFDGKTYKQVP